MRPEPNNDIDLLLRQLSRRNGVPVSETEEQHLDADELNSYVANALPGAARIRYTEHLADCSSCRKIVAQLSAAEGPVTVRQTATAVAPSGLKSFLASLFSPMVLRYAVPALGLIVIAAVGIFVFQSDRKGSGTVAQLSEETRSVAVPMPQQEAPASSSPQMVFDSPANTNANKEEPHREAAAPVTKETGRAKAADDADPRGDTAGASAGAPPAAPKVAAPVVQNEAPPAPADSAKTKKEQAETVAVQANPNEPIKRDYNSGEGANVVVTPGQTTRRDVQIQPAQRSVTPMGRGSVAKAPAKSNTESRADSREAAKDEDLAAAETRSVAGRRFRKSAGVWIDTAYDSSKPITSVARGSEQYRALVGDEPSIKTIADELDGQIVLVWKGRTYRIR